MALRHLARNLFRCAKTSNVQTRLLPLTTVQSQTFKFSPIRFLSSTRTDQNAYRDLETFLHKEIQLEKNVQKHPNNLPMIENFQVSNHGPQVTLTGQIGDSQVLVKFTVVNCLNANDLDRDANLNPFPQDAQSTTQLKARPNFNVEISKSGTILSFVCSFLPSDYAEGIYQKSQSNQTQESPEEVFEDFQIDEFTLHEGEWSERLYSSDCSVIDGELYDKLLNLLDEHGIGENFANQLADFATAFEHRQYINLLEKLQTFVRD